jgi:hypothetical protein
MPNKLERFTQRSRRVLMLAQEEAERMQHASIDTEHLLLGLMREEGGVAHRVLSDLGVDQQQLESQVQALSQAGIRSGAMLELSNGVKKSLELAVDEARRMGHHYIGTEHLLLGLMRQDSGAAVEILQRLNVKAEQVRRHAHQILKDAPPPAGRQETGDFSSTRTPIFGPIITGESLQCDVFALLPDGDTFQAVYGTVIKPAVIAHELSIKSVEDFAASPNRVREIWSCIIRAKFIIADCSGSDPNVFYMLGIAHTLGQPTIILSQDRDTIPLMLRGTEILLYTNTPEGFKALETQLRDAIERISNETE